MPAFLEIERAEVTLGSLRVLQGVSVSIGKGKCLAILGPSGCGKSTLLNAVAGFVPLDAGRISCNGRALDDPAARRFVPIPKRRFATVFQDFSLWPHMSVAENVAFGLRVQGLDTAERERRTRDALTKVRMLDYANRLPSELSGGQQQRVAIARALAFRPDLLLFDEPLSALDARLRAELRAEIARLLRDEGLTAVYVTHDQAEAFSLGDTVAVMREGRLEQVDDPETLYRFPRTRFVASFIGAANTVPFEQREGRLILDGHFRLPARKDWPPRGWCYIRREGVHIRGVSEDAREVAVCADRQFLGARVEAVARWPSGFELAGEAVGPVFRGDRVCVEIDPAHMGLLYDPA
ncbi:MAG: ABC transporter ATP-binding protein [Kiritimatiellae bacterium]|nr:ABC transporter ATP-binding protein [Kiritimatiellia bacterium]MDW8459205.1 ABC transporter ATP-binding protein [Verrucomicrobiota bacterium]